MNVALPPRKSREHYYARTYDRTKQKRSTAVMKMEALIVSKLLTPTPQRSPWGMRNMEKSKLHKLTYPLAPGNDVRTSLCFR